MTLLDATRATFAGLSRGERIAWYALAVISTLIFFWGVLRLWRRYRRAEREPRPPEPRHVRLQRTLRTVLAHTMIRRRAPWSGAAHLLVFYGFLVLFAGTVILAFQDDVARPLFGWDFWHSAFYLGYSLFLDVFGAGLVVGLTFLGARRLAGRLRRVHYDAAPPRNASRYVVGDWVFLVSLYFIALTGFLLESVRIAATLPSFEVWSPIGWAVGHGLNDLGLSGSTANSTHFVLWWIHGLTAITFVAAIPFTKGLHMLIGPAGVAWQDQRPGAQLPELAEDAAAAEVGYQRLGQFTMAHLVGVDSCTRCGKCDEVCPARASGYPLAPRSVVLDLKQAASKPDASLETMIVPDVLTADSMWSCTQCMACVEICPVGIEHVPIIASVRRGLVEQGELEPALQRAFEQTQTSGNSFGEPRRKRARWTRDLDFELKDARKTGVDILWFVGDYASLDARNQENTKALAQLLRLAGVDVGILYDAESTAGNDIRRAGEEVLFRTLAEGNIEQLNNADFNRILTSDPHTFNTLRNDYPALGGEWTSDQIVHHSQLLLELLDRDQLDMSKQLGRRRGTYHDPCALGRYNGVYDEPRALLDRIGIDLVEMPRNRDNSFCCGAGGGRIWMSNPKSTAGARRPSEQRIDEAVALPGVDLFVVACPKDVTMYEDAIKTSGHDGAIVLRELSQLVLEACAP